MKFRVIALLLAAVMLLSLCGCGEEEAVQPQTSSSDVVTNTDVSPSDADNWYDSMDETGKMLADVVLSSTDAFNAKDAEGYMASVDPESGSYAETKEYVGLVFEKYNLLASIDEIEVVSVKGDKASLRVTQTTIRNGSGKKFADSQSVLLHTMICREGVWYISETIVEAYTQLNSNWDVLADYVSGSDVSPSDTVEITA